MLANNACLNIIFPFVRAYKSDWELFLCPDKNSVANRKRSIYGRWSAHYVVQTIKS